MQIHHEDAVLLEKGAPHLYPFLFEREIKLDETDSDRRFFVMIALWDMIILNTGWMDDPNLGDQVLVPDVDLQAGLYEFDSETDALRFVQEWWVKQEF